MPTVAIIDSRAVAQFAGRVNCPVLHGVMAINHTRSVTERARRQATRGTARWKLKLYTLPPFLFRLPSFAGPDLSV